MKRMPIIRFFCLLFFGPYIISCQKIDYTTMDSPAYLRVFNSVNHYQGMEIKGDTSTYLCMLVDPELDAAGIPTAASIVGDYLTERETYAPPYPVHIGVSTTKANPEYPGKESVLAAPVLNGFDLSSWAQVPSGTHRFLFMTRPRDEVSFFDLPEREKGNILIDTTVRLEPGEVYTMHILLEDYLSKKRGFLMRQENFYKQSFSDSLVYVNFYNYSAKGYWMAPIERKVPTGLLISDMNNFVQGIRDTMNIFLTLFNSQTYGFQYPGSKTAILKEPATPISQTYTNRFLTTLYRDTRSGITNPYFSFPLWAAGADNRTYTDMWESFAFLSPGIELTSVPVTRDGMGINDGLNPFVNGSLLTTLNCIADFDESMFVAQPTSSGFGTNHTGFTAPNLIINTHSGTDNPRSFATVNTIEVINGKAYLMTIQRKYAAPIY